MLHKRLHVYAGVAFRSEEFVLVGEDGGVLTVSAYDIISSARATYGDSTAAIEFTVDIVSDLEGRFELVASAAQTSGLPAEFVRQGHTRLLGWDMLGRAAGSGADYRMLATGAVELHPTYSVVPA